MKLRLEETFGQPAFLLFLSCVLASTNSAVAETALNMAFWNALGSTSTRLDKVLPARSGTFGLNESCLVPTINYNSLNDCLPHQCVAAEDVAKLYNVSPAQTLQADDIERMAPAILYGLLQPKTCRSVTRPGYHHKEKPSAGAVWGYSFLFVTLINLCSLAGAIVLPCMNMAVYKLILMFLVALAVGTLVGSGLLVLIPEALELTMGEGEESLMYVWKVTTVMGGIYLFFITERIMRMVNNWRENKKQIKKEKQHIAGAFYPVNAPENPLFKMKDLSSYSANDSFGPCNLVSYSASQANLCNATDSSNGEENTGVDNYGCEESGKANVYTVETNGHASPPPSRSDGHQHHQHVAPVAYMIVFGDALHNFIDGLSIGAAFSENILLGVSVAVAVMCEELPHELGDFAILLNSGMRLRKAVMYNFLSSLSCYVGLVIGILLGENTSANTWIFAVAGGMFLYISLVDMLPEMNSAAETEEGQKFGEKKTFLLQNFGLLLGYGIILILAIFGGNINFEE